jgi:hypothetical protein
LAVVALAVGNQGHNLVLREPVEVAGVVHKVLQEEPVEMVWLY